MCKILFNYVKFYGETLGIASFIINEEKYTILFLFWLRNQMGKIIHFRKGIQWTKSEDGEKGNLMRWGKLEQLKLQIVIKLQVRHVRNDEIRLIKAFCYFALYCTPYSNLMTWPG